MIYKRGKVYQYEFTIKGKRYRGTTGKTNRVIALQVEADKRSNVGKEKQPKGNGDLRPGTFKEVFECFLLWAASHVKPKTLRRYGVSGKRLGAHFGSRAVSELRQADIEDFKTARRTECSNAGVNRDLACLKTFFSWCVRMSYCMKNPVIGVKFLKESPGNMRIVTPEEEAIYLANARLPLHDVAVLMLNTGMRPDEVFRIMAADCDFENKFIRIREGKTVFARRTIPLTAQAEEVLKRRMTDGYLFKHRFKDAPMVCSRAHLRLIKRLGFNFRLYDFRHTFGSRMTMAGVDLPTLKELMGHASITTTMRYIHPTPEHKVAAIKKLEGAHKVPTIVK
jgi:integrase